MSKIKPGKKARLLFGIWCAFYMVFNVGSSFYVSYQQIHGSNPTAFLSTYQLTTLAVISLFFLPTLFGIHQLTKQYDSKKLKRIVRWLLVVLSAWTVGMIICTIAAVIDPDFIA